MQQVIDIILSPRDASDEKKLRNTAATLLQVSPDDISFIRTLKRSIDARKKEIKINLRLLVYVNEPMPTEKTKIFEYQNVSDKPEVIIIGAGPAGLFAALRLIELGYKPLIFERGKTINDRKADINALHNNQIVNPDSNYCFGEGGAGTFSDGKLFTRSNKRGNISKILEVLHFHGANENILFEAHPHIGTNKLPAIISNIRNSIENAGGRMFFNSRVTDFIIENSTIKGIITNTGEKHFAKSVILATGHSARDIYELLHSKNIALEAKSFAMGVRAEHPQELIDKIQYHGEARGTVLPAASYNLVEQVNGRGVFSFCMCPGGFIVPASTAKEEIVVNGMSPSDRNNALANSGIVTEIKPDDLKEYEQFGVLAGLKFQEHFEKTAFKNGGGGLIAPSQRLNDFVHGYKSSTLPKTSYHPGIISSNFNEWLPPMIGSALSQAFRLFERKMKGYLTNDAIIIGVESRTSSPVRIPRNYETFEHIQIKGLFPCGEGAGYAGGIVSSAMDGEKCAEKAIVGL